MRFVDLKLNWKITLVAGLVFLPAMAVGTLFFYQRVYDLEVLTALNGLMNFVDAKQQGVIRFIGQNEKLAKQLGALTENAPTETLRGHFAQIVATDVFDPKAHPFKEEIQSGKRRIATLKVYHAIDWVKDGVIAVSSDPAREGKRWERKIDLNHGYSEVWRDGDVPVLSFGAPTNGGVLYVHADARMLTNIVNGEIGNLQGGMGAFYLAGVGKSFDYYVVNQDNVLITESRVRPDALLKHKGSEYPWLVTQQKAQVVCGKSGTYTTNAGCTTGCREAMGFYDGPQGKRVLGASMPFYDSGWTIVVEQEADEVLEPLVALRNLMAGLGVLLGTLAFGTFMLVVNRYITRPLTDLTHAVGGITGSDGLIDLSFDPPSGRGDEIGEIGSAFAALLGRFRSVVDEIRSESARLAGAVGDFSQAYTQVAQASERQLDRATEVAATVEELSASVSQVSCLADATRHLAREDMEMSQAGAGQAHTAADEMQRIANSVADSSKLVDKLNERSAQIGGIVQVIQEIAEQTNLLALNAAIEAARAGEQGRGFAVVADEVRKLAERTSTSTAEIRGLIEAIHHEVGEAVAGMETTRNQAESGVALVDAARSSLDSISDSARQTAAKVEDIAAATLDQNTAGAAASAKVAEIAHMAEAANAVALQIADGVRNLETLAAHLEQTVAHFKAA